MKGDQTPLTRISEGTHDGFVIYGIENLTDDLIEVEYITTKRGHSSKGKGVIHPKKIMWFSYDETIQVVSERFVQMPA